MMLSNQRLWLAVMGLLLITLQAPAIGADDTEAPLPNQNRCAGACTARAEIRVTTP